MSDKYHKPEHYAAILRDRATIERTVRGEEGYNGLAANFDAAADMLNIQSAKIVANNVLLTHFKSEAERLTTEGAVLRHEISALRDFMRLVDMDAADSWLGKNPVSGSQ